MLPTSLHTVLRFSQVISSTVGYNSHLLWLVCLKPAACCHQKASIHRTVKIYFSIPPRLHVVKQMDLKPPNEMKVGVALLQRASFSGFQTCQFSVFDEVHMCTWDWGWCESSAHVPCTSSCGQGIEMDINRAVFLIISLAKSAYH